MVRDDSMSSATHVDIRTEVAIVGGGVAGSSLGSALAAAGVDVVIMERERQFRDRIRGEALHPWGVPEADKIGLLPVLEQAGAHEMPYKRYYGSGGRDEQEVLLTEHSPAGFGAWSIYHPTLQSALLDHARQAGAKVLRPAKAKNCDVDGDQPVLEVRGPDGDVRVGATLVVAANGRLSGSRRWIGANRQGDPTDHHLIGGCLLHGGSVPLEAAHVGFGEGKYSAVYPQKDGFTRAYLMALPSIGWPIQKEQDFDSFVAEIAETLPAGVCDGVEQAGPLGFFPGTNTWVDRLTGPGIVLIGDAAMATDPSVGHGLSLVFRDARELRDLLVSDDNWQLAIEEFERRRSVYQQPLRCHGMWLTELEIDTGPEAVARRERVEGARQSDPTAGGYTSIDITGPDGLATDEAARQRYFGEVVPA